MNPGLKDLQIPLGVADGLHISVEVIQFGPKHRVHRLCVREIVGLEHVDQKMDRCSMRLILGKHRIEREPIAVEDLLNVSRPPFLEIVDHENIPVIERKEVPCRKTNLICVSVLESVYRSRSFADGVVTIGLANVDRFAESP